MGREALRRVLGCFIGEMAVGPFDPDRNHMPRPRRWPPAPPDAETDRIGSVCAQSVGVDGRVTPGHDEGDVGAGRRLGPPFRFVVGLRAEICGCGMPASTRPPGRVKGPCTGSRPPQGNLCPGPATCAASAKPPISYAANPGAEGSVRHGAGRAGQRHGHLLADGPPAGRGGARAAARLPGGAGRGAQRAVLPLPLQHGGRRLRVVAAPDDAGRRPGRAAARSAGLDPRALRGRRTGRLLRAGCAVLAGHQPQLFRPDAAGDRHRRRATRSCARRSIRCGGRARAG